MSYNGTSDEDARKLFIGGLPADATSESVKEYFSHYGEVDTCTVKTDMYTGRSRGFAFLIYKEKDSVNSALSVQEGHSISGKSVDVKLATPQRGGEGQKSSKIFVGGLPPSVSKESLKTLFEQRGTVTDTFIPVDMTTKEQKGFAFVTFDNASIAETLCSEGKIFIDGKECDIKKAHDKNESRGGGRGGFRGGRGGGGRGGYGDYNQGYGGGYDQYGGGQYGSYGQGGYGGGQGGYGGGQSYGGGYDQSSYNSYDQSGGYGK